MVGYISTGANTSSRITTLSMEVGEEDVFYYYYNGATIFNASGSSSDTSVVKITMGNTLRSQYYPFTLEAVGAGTATITVYTNSNTDTYRATLTVTVGGGSSGEEEPTITAYPVISGPSTAAIGSTQTYTVTSSNSSYPLTISGWYVRRGTTGTVNAAESITMNGTTTPCTATIKFADSTNLSAGDTVRILVGYTSPSGSASSGGTYNVTMTADENTVSSISVSGSLSINGGASPSSATYTATTSPTTATNRYVTWSIISGSSYASISSTSNTTTGGRCTVRATTVTTSRTVVLRATAADGGGAYVDKTITINPVLVSSITLTASADEGIAGGNAIRITASTSPSNASVSGVTWSIISGSASFNQQTTTYATVYSDVAGNVTIRATARDGSGTYRDITIPFIQEVPATSIAVSQSSFEMKVDETQTFTLTLSPSNTTTDTFSTSYSTSGIATLSYTQTGSDVGTTTWTGSIWARAEGTVTITITAGNATQTIYVTVRPAVNYVEDIQFAYLYDTTLKIGEYEGPVSCTAWPSYADDRTLVASIVSGSEYATISSTATDSGCRFTFTVTGAPDTGGAEVVVRVQAQDEGAYYEDIVFTVTRINYAGTLQFSPSSGTVFCDRQFTTRVLNLNDETCTVTVTGGTGEVTLAQSTNGLVYLQGVTPGTVTLQAVSSDTGATAEATFTVSDEFPYDSTNRILLYFGELSFTTVSSTYSGRIIHGGYASVTLQEGVTWAGANVIPAYSDSSLVVSNAATNNGPYNRYSSELGDRVVYLTDPDDGTTTRMTVSVVAKGDYTKQIVFDARVPEGSYLIQPCPGNLSQDYTTEDGFEFVIPEEEPTAEGQVFIWWEVDADSLEFCEYTHVYPGMRMTVTGQDTIVTLHAVWFPVLEWCTVTNTRMDGRVDVSIEIPVNAVLNADVPNLGINLPSAYPITVMTDTGGSGITGVSFYSGSSEITLAGYSITSGRLSIRGTPTTLGETLTFRTTDVPVDTVTRETRYTVTVVSAPSIPDTSTTVSVVLDADGGLFPNGQSRVTLEVMDDTYVLPDWSVVDRPGYRLSGWSGSYTGSAAMGSEQNTVETWTAQWVRDVRGYDTRYLPHASVRIYRSLLEYIDATELLTQGGQPVVTIAENQAGSATFTLLNDWRSPGYSLLADDCDLWNTGSAGPVQTGMYVRMDSINSDGTVSYLMDGLITTITPSEGTVSFEIGDRMTFLGKSGATYRRNFYGRSRTSGYFPAGHDDTGLYADVSSLPADSIIDGTCYWKVMSSESLAQSSSLNVGILSWGNQGDRSKCTLTISTTHSRIESITIPIGLQGSNWPGTYTYLISIKVTSGSNGYSYHYSLQSSSLSTAMVDLVMDFGGEGLDITGGTITLEFTLGNHSGSDGAYVMVHYAMGGDWTLTDANGNTVTGISIRSVTEWSDLYEIVSRSSSVTNGRLYVTAIQYKDSLDDETLWTPSANRVRIPYITGSQSVLSIARTMAWGIGLTPISSPSVPDAELTMFRTGGGFALDYLQTLADVADSEGRRRAFSCRGFTTPMLTFTARHTISDTAQAHIHYGGDTPEGNSTERIAFSSFSPSMTMKNRPNMAMVRGTMSSRGDTESRPIIVAVEDDDSTTRRFGLVVEAIMADSSVNLTVDAASSAWGKVQESDLDEWEGLVTVPDIRRDLMPISGTYGGSGVALLLTDSRMGILGVRARARQLKLDFNACTTSVTLTNRSMAYSSSISETTAMAATTADVATGDNSITLFNTQYVRVKTGVVQNVSSSGNVVTGTLTNGGQFTFEDVSVLQLPNGRSILVASAPADPDATHAGDSEPYAVVSITINGGDPLPIKQSRRPDYYAGQTLVINVDYPTS